MDTERMERDDMQRTDGVDAPPEQSGRDAGLPGGGQGRREKTGTSGVYPVSDMEGADGEAPVRGQMEFGQGERGAAGYDDSGDSELNPSDLSGRDADRPGRASRASRAGQTGQGDQTQEGDVDNAAPQPKDPTNPAADKLSGQI